MATPARYVVGAGLAALLLVMGGCKEKKSTPEDDTSTDAPEDTDDMDTTTDVPVEPEPDTAGDVPADEVTDAPDDVPEDVEADEVQDDATDVVEDVTDVTDLVDEEIVAAVCGDGSTDTGEACDDSNAVTEACDGVVAESCAADCSMRLDLCGNASPDEGEQCDDGNDDSTDGCTTSCTTNDTGIGAPCTCSGVDCDPLDFTSGTINGCAAAEALADSTRTLACVRSAHEATYDVSTYMAGGYCTLMALGCAGPLCFLVPTTGNVATFECPAGYVEATDVTTPISGLTVTAKTCLVACTSDVDCRWNEVEPAGSPWVGECGQYACLPAGDGGALGCTDPRN